MRINIIIDSNVDFAIGKFVHFFVEKIFLFGEKDGEFRQTQRFFSKFFIVFLLFVEVFDLIFAFPLFYYFKIVVCPLLLVENTDPSEHSALCVGGTVASIGDAFSSEQISFFISDFDEVVDDLAVIRQIDFMD